MEGLERDDAAKALGITSITVRRHLSLAKDRLREALTEKK
jgi:DNA-directed RNA polymerase specialized sigma24 family protein